MEIITKSQTWTVLSLIEWSTNYLLEKGFESPRLNVELLLAHTLRCQRIQLYTSFDKPLTKEELAVFKSYFQRRLHHEPLDYIIGESEFMGLKFCVNKNVLVPRPETEVLVEQVIQHCQKKSERTLRILDIGTGSGNIAISLAKFLSNVSIDALDVSEDALTVAKKNAQRHAVTDKISFIHADILCDVLDRHDGYDVIVSNPPYIAKSEFLSLQPEVRDFEPAVATTDNADGFTFHKKIADIGRSLLLKKGGWLFIEFSYNQSEGIQKIFIDAGYQNVELIRDYSGILRVLKAKKG